MSSLQQIRQFRFLERIILLIGVGVGGGLAWLWFTDKIEWYELYAGVGVVVVVFLILFFVQQKVFELVTVAISQSDFVQDDLFSAMYDKSPVAYLSILIDGTIVGSNPAAVKLLGGRVDTIGNSNMFELMQADEKIDPSIVQGKVAAGLTMNDVEVLMKNISGEHVWVMMSVYVHRNKGQRLVALVDITEKKHIDTAKSEFVALATHQLRTPIAAIRWNVELLQKNIASAETEKQLRYLEKVERNVFRMINLINDFLSVSKLEMGTFAAQEEDFNLTEFFDSIQDEYAEKITTKQITLDRLDLPPGAVIKTDSRLFHIIVSNLVSNAVKYLVLNGTLVLSYQIIDDTLQIVVADNGIGIPESEIDNLFTKFYRASNAQSHQTEGTGLGLYVVKQSVELLGGTISVSAKENEGARFEVLLPVKVVSLPKIG